MTRCWENCPLCGCRCTLDGKPHHVHRCDRVECNMVSWRLRKSMPRDLPRAGVLVTVMA